jgi:hypothetical protein
MIGPQSGWFKARCGKFCKMARLRLQVVLGAAIFAAYLSLRPPRGR